MNGPVRSGLKEDHEKKCIQILAVVVGKRICWNPECPEPQHGPQAACMQVWKTCTQKMTYAGLTSNGGSLLAPTPYSQSNSSINSHLLPPVYSARGKMKHWSTSSLTSWLWLMPDRTTLPLSQTAFHIHTSTSTSMDRAILLQFITRYFLTTSLYPLNRSSSSKVSQENSSPSSALRESVFLKAWSYNNHQFHYIILHG